MNRQPSDKLKKLLLENYQHCDALEDLLRSHCMAMVQLAEDERYDLTFPRDQHGLRPVMPVLRMQLHQELGELRSNLVSAGTVASCLTLTKKLFIELDELNIRPVSCLEVLDLLELKDAPNLRFYRLQLTAILERLEHYDGLSATYAIRDVFYRYKKPTRLPVVSTYPPEGLQPSSAYEAVNQAFPRFVVDVPEVADAV